MMKIVFIDWSGNEIPAPIQSENPREDYLKAIEMVFNHKLRSVAAVKLVHSGNYVDSTFSLNEQMYESLKPRERIGTTSTRLCQSAPQNGKRLPSIRTSVKI